MLMRRDRLRFIILIENRGYRTDHRTKILNEVRAIVGNKCATVGDVRIATNHIELDFFLDKDCKEGLNKFLDKISKVGKTLSVNQLYTQEAPLGKYDIIRKGIELFNDERFWEAHEVLEEAWKMSIGEEKSIIKGLILVCAAFVHLQKGNVKSSRSTAARAFKALRDKGFYIGLNLDWIAERIKQVTDEGVYKPFKLICK